MPEKGELCRARESLWVQVGGFCVGTAQPCLGYELLVLGRTGFVPVQQGL